MSDPLHVYRDDPARFAADVLGLQLSAAEQAALETLRDNKTTVIGNNPDLSGIAVVWFFCTRVCVVITTAPTLRQMKYLTWGGVRKALRQPLRALPCRLVGGQRLVVDGVPGWWAAGVIDWQKLQGVHAKELLIVAHDPRYLSVDIAALLQSYLECEGARLLSVSRQPWVEPSELKESPSLSRMGMMS